MEQRLDLITVGVPDVDAARAFYLDGLGWTPVHDVPGEIVFFQIGHGLVLALWGQAELHADAGGAATTPGGFALAHNVESDAAVDQVLAAAERAGATILKPAQHADFGGYHGYFADPSGIRWEVAHNPGWSVDPDGTVHLRALPG